MLNPAAEFSFRSREKAIERFHSEVFDLLIVGGGITGAAVARDASSRGLKVALVERKDFAFGTSSRSSKLIHGGLRYLQNLELNLVFEALAERARLLKSAPHMVRPLPFYLPVYDGDAHGRGVLGMGLWLYDLLALFRTPGFHRSLSREKILAEIPFLKDVGLRGGFRYFDASMWDDVLAVETLRAAQESGAAIANYVEAMDPLWDDDRITGFRVRDLEAAPDQATPWELRAHKTVICVGPWTDQLGIKLSKKWSRWLSPSKGVHLVFDLKRIPMPGAMVMSHPEDGRVAFVIPRPEFGSGVAIVGTTDGPTHDDPDRAEISAADVEYLIDLLHKYFPKLELSASDVLSAYVGVRPLMGGSGNLAGSEGQTEGRGQQDSPDTSSVLQKVSREHHIDLGPGKTVIVAGGKYTTHRRMAEEIVDFTLKTWRQEWRTSKQPPLPRSIRGAKTKGPLNPRTTRDAIRACRAEAEKRNLKIPEELIRRYGADVFSIIDDKTNEIEDPNGFPFLKSQLRYAIRNEMVVHLEDFYLRRVPLYSSRKDHGLPWARALVEVWAEERGLNPSTADIEYKRLEQELAKRSAWQTART